ncbi:MAG: hypothetical protein NVSMB39_0780 [Candidatus Saccharimonadales bacterium]
MKSDYSLSQRLAQVLIPTRFQTAVALVLAIVIVVADNLTQAVNLTGVDSATVKAFTDQYHMHSTGILATKLAGSAALITFWAAVGMIAYLICWSSYNLMIEARNEVTLKTQYTNRGHWRGPYETIGLKSLSAVLLVLSLMILKPGFDLWLSLSASMFANTGLMTIASGLVAVIGLAAQLYLVLAMALLTFTPWYRKEAFTLR